MSDFGTLITVFTRDQTDMSEREHEAVVAAVDSISRGQDTWTDALGEPFVFRIGAAMRPIGDGSSKHQHGVSVCLSEYWAPMLDELQDTAEELLALDTKTAWRVGDCLKSELREFAFDIDLVSGDW